jgi:hypothetical protein
MIWASCNFNGYDYDYLPVLNPGECGGKTWLVELLGCVPVLVVVEAASVHDALIVLSRDPEFGEGIQLARDGKSSEADCRRVFNKQNVRVYGQAESDLPYPVRYHQEGFLADGIDPREFAVAWLN